MTGSERLWLANTKDQRVIAKAIGVSDRYQPGHSERIPGSGDRRANYQQRQNLSYKPARPLSKCFPELERAVNAIWLVPGYVAIPAHNCSIT